MNEHSHLVSSRRLAGVGHRRRARRWASLVVIVLVLGSAGASAPSVLGHAPFELKHFGSATVDGVISEGEYGKYGPGGSCVHPPSQTIAGVMYSYQLCVTNDDTTDYYAFRINDLTKDHPSPGQFGVDVVHVFFDNAHDGTIGACPNGGRGESRTGGFEDWVAAVAGDSVLFDAAYGFVPPPNANPCLVVDDQSGGQNDGQVASTFTHGEGWVFEFSHPLDSGDAFDHSLAIHDTVGFCAIYGDGSNDVGDVVFPKGCDVDSYNNGSAEKFADFYQSSQIDALLAALESLVATCETCPPDVRGSLDEYVNVAIDHSRDGNDQAVSRPLADFNDSVKRYEGEGHVSAHEARLLTEASNHIIESIEAGQA
jgi:hypothetical protein